MGKLNKRVVPILHNLIFPTSDKQRHSKLRDVVDIQMRTESALVPHLLFKLPRCRTNCMHFCCLWDIMSSCPKWINIELVSASTSSLSIRRIVVKGQITHLDGISHSWFAHADFWAIPFLSVHQMAFWCLPESNRIVSGHLKRK